MNLQNEFAATTKQLVVLKTKFLDSSVNLIKTRNSVLVNPINVSLPAYGLVS